MRNRQTMMKPLFRSLAAVVLVAFVVAQEICVAHCNLGGEHADSCHGASSAQPGHDEGNSSSPPVPSPAASCFTVQNLMANGDAPTLVVPEFHALYALSLLALALDATATEPTTPISRTAWPRDWIFTPEVCTGPANRILAPPLLS